MFTGIIETLGQITAVETSGTNRTFTVISSISNELKVDQSLSHNGVCLTVEKVANGEHTVTAIQETLQKTTLDNWETGKRINLERCLTANGRLDGHFVQGHVDTAGACIDKKTLSGSWEFRFEFPEKFAPLVIEKGSIALNGISLTIFDVTLNQFSVAIIPYTYEHTTMQYLHPGEKVNLEFDMVGKYVVRGRDVEDKNILPIE
ncbi:MAG: riboflavin synthase [Sphingobacteriales bacterium]|nr:riboflavin synthase [Sphingobacteriales bacterium]OJY84468.1 MAG: riboflavin synthase subunit alpha [Sphingobacteriales bacterium 44-15]